MSLFWQISEVVALLVVVFYLASLPLRKSKDEKSLPPVRKLTPTEAEWMADYFHSGDGIDIDGYIGTYYLPAEALKVYHKKYAKDRGWTEEDVKECEYIYNDTVKK